MSNHVTFHLPTKPYNIIAAINRMAAATGSMRYAGLTSSADYNGHQIGSYFNDYRQYYVCDYFWAGRVVIARGGAMDVTRAAVDEYKRQGLGASLAVAVRPEDADCIRSLNLGLIEGPEPKALGDWYSWKHSLIADAFMWDKWFPGIGTQALLVARDEDDYRFLTSAKGRGELANRKYQPEVA